MGREFAYRRLHNKLFSWRHYEWLSKVGLEPVTVSGEGCAPQIPAESRRESWFSVS